MGQEAEAEHGVQLLQGVQLEPCLVVDAAPAPLRRREQRLLVEPAADTRTQPAAGDTQLAARYPEGRTETMRAGHTDTKSRCECGDERLRDAPTPVAAGQASTAGLRTNGHRATHGSS